MRRGVIWVVAATIALSASGCASRREADFNTRDNTEQTVKTLKRIERLLIDIRKQNDLP